MKGPGGSQFRQCPALAAEDDAPLPGTPHLQGRRLEPVPSPSELLIEPLSSGTAVLPLTPPAANGTAGHAGTPVLPAPAQRASEPRAGSTEEVTAIPATAFGVRSKTRPGRAALGRAFPLCASSAIKIIQSGFSRQLHGQRSTKQKRRQKSPSLQRFVPLTPAGERGSRGGGCPRCLGTRWSRGDVLRVALPRAAASHGGFAPHLSLVPTAAPRATGPVGKAAVPRKP